MSESRVPAATFVRRVELVGHRLWHHALGGIPTGLTQPDPQTGERWDAGQVWAHMAEFLPYWMDEVHKVIGCDGQTPAPFGRTKSDPVRIAAIEADRHDPPTLLLAQLAVSLSKLKTLLGQVPEDRWSAVGRHPTLGDMTLADIVERFLVGHLEEHMDQLEGLA